MVPRYYISGRHCCLCTGIGMMFTSGRGQVRTEKAGKLVVFFYTEHMYLEARILNMQQLWWRDGCRGRLPLVGPSASDSPVAREAECNLATGTKSKASFIGSAVLVWLSKTSLELFVSTCAVILLPRRVEVMEARNIALSLIFCRHFTFNYFSLHNTVTYQKGGF